jgi:DNA (cytosine-5)-methyltransferase 1
MPNNPGVVSSVCTKWSKGTGGPSGSGHFNLVAQPVAGTLGRAIAKSRTELDNHGAYIPMAIQAGAIRENPASGPDGVGVRTDGVAYTIEARAEVQAVGQPVPYNLFQITAPVNRQNRKPGDPCHTPARDNAAHAAVAFSDTSATLKGGSGERGYPDPSDGNGHSLVAHSLRGEGFDASEDGTGRGTPLIPQAMTVRRLTARECERLQAFPDDYTLIPWRKKQAEDCPDGPRYKALGNSMAVNCMAWIGERIAALENNR